MNTVQRALSAVLWRKNKHAFLVDLGSYLQLDLQNTEERDPRERSFKDKQGQTECKHQRMYSEGSERQRVSEASRAPTLCHMPSECVCSVWVRGCVDIPTDDILKEWNQHTRFDSAKTSLQFSSCRAKSIPKLKWHCHFRRGFLQFRHARPQGTVDDSSIQCKEHSQQCYYVRTSTLF